MLSEHTGIKLKINNRKIPVQSQNIQRLNNILPNSTQVKEVSRKVLKYFGLNEKENATQQNLWDAMKAVLRGESTALNV